MTKKWTLKPLAKSPAEIHSLEALSEELSISTPLATLLWQRGIHNFEEAKYFFRPQLEHLHDPFLMKDMDQATERLQNAIKNNEKILIYGDYDVDGTTAVALFYGFLLTHYQNIEYYNPDRYKEGYGVSQIAIDWAKSKNISLIISLDCGIKANDKVAYAKTLGIDFIICDHHEPGEELPEAVAVLDPKRKDCHYPFKELTGNGVGFKLLTAFCTINNIPFESLLEYIDLAMVSIASDIVPIVGENRILAYYGLQKINTNPRTGLKALKEVAGFQGEMSIENVVFVLGPRINAAGRIKHAKAAVQLLLENDYTKAVDFAYEIQKHNTERKVHDSSITDQALDMIRSDHWLLNQAKSTVLFKEDWHKGVIGIVASRCIESFYRPTVIFTKTKENMAAGSARSVSGFDLYAAIEECSHLLEQFGGHMHAAGMTIEIENIPKFRMAFDKIANRMLRPDQLVPEITIDLEIPISEISPKFYRIMKQMAPFGPHNMQPIFMSKNLQLGSEPKVLKEKHLKLELLDSETGMTITALAFGMAEQHLEDLKAEKSFDAVYSIEENTFRGQSTLQFYIRDLKFN
jgi:single-stranded-DNA-specific exonuclease